MGKTFRYEDDETWAIPEAPILRPNSKLVRGDSRLDRIRARREKEELKLSSLTAASK